MVLVQRVEVGVRASASTLVVLAADKTCINVYVGERNRAELLKVEVQESAFD